MEWSDEYKVGIPEIDAQHRNLAMLIAGLKASVDAGRDRVHVDLVMLAKYNRAHFSAEETLMLAHAYPASEAHLSEHEQFTQALADLEERSATQSVTPELIALLRAWEDQHVKVSDRHLARHVSISKRLSSDTVPKPGHGPGGGSLERT